MPGREPLTFYEIAIGASAPSGVVWTSEKVAVIPAADLREAAAWAAEHLPAAHRSKRRLIITRVASANTAPVVVGED